MRLKLAAFVLTSGIAFAAGANAADKPKLVDTFRDWHVYSGGKGADRTCYLLAVPTGMTPKNLKRGDAFFLISNWPASKVKHEPSVVPGYQYKDMGVVQVQIGSDKFSFAAQNQGANGGAWAQMPEDEAKVVTAMKGGAQMVVTGVSSKGVLTKDEYSLAGFSAALDKLDSTCK